MSQARVFREGREPAVFENRQSVCRSDPNSARIIAADRPHVFARKPVFGRVICKLLIYKDTQTVFRADPDIPGRIFKKRGCDIASQSFDFRIAMKLSVFVLHQSAAVDRDPEFAPAVFDKRLNVIAFHFRGVSEIEERKIDAVETRLAFEGAHS